MKVNCFIVGWPKTGSTSLYDYINQHPDVFVSKKKDTYYFCDDLRQSSVNFHGKNKYNFTSSINEYNSHFNTYANEKVICESSVFYAVSNNAAKNIYDYSPDAKIIILLRDPIELMNSWYNYQKLHSRETAATFKEALQQEDLRKKDHSLIPKITYMPEHVYYRSMVRYDEGIARFKEFFKNDAIKIIFTEDLKNNSLETVQSVYDFLEVDSVFTPDIKMKNVTVKSKNKVLKEIIDNTLRPLKVTLKKTVTYNVHKKAKKIYTALFFDKKKASKNKAINSENELNDFLLPILNNTSKLIAVDLLKKWNYNDNE